MKTTSGGIQNSLQSLPPKWDCLFKQIVKQYETKQFEKALRSANEMLKAWPEHAETLAVKGHLLMLSEKSDVDQAPLEFGRQAVRLNIKSAFCWRILGKIYQAEKIYGEAIKCYRQVVKLEPENLQIMQDLAVMEICERDITGLVKTRKALLRAVPSDRANWMGLAIAYELNGELATASKIIEELERSNDHVFQPVEQSEHELYKVRLLMRQSKYTEVLAWLPSISHTILEKKKLLLIEAECLQHIGEKKQAESVYTALLQEHPDFLKAIQGIIATKASFKFTGNFQEYEEHSQDCKEIEKILDNLTKISPLAQHIALCLSDDSTFGIKIQRFMIPYIQLNIPSIFSNIKRFYKSPEKSIQIEKCLLSFEEDLKKNGHLDGETYPNPTALLWVYLLLCMHYIRVSKLMIADSYYQKAKEHSPTSDAVFVIQTRLAKAKKDSVSLLGALKLMTMIDPKDRYSSNRYVKHLLRNHEFEHAETIFKQFNLIREKDMLKHIVDIQCLWYEQELADASYQNDDVLSALQLYLLIIKQFKNFRTEEREFHSYCLRRGMFSSYLDTLETNDKLTAHPSWIRAAHGAIQCFLDIFNVHELAQLESQRTQYGKKIALNESIGTLPDLRHPLSKAMDVMTLIERYDDLNPKSFFLSSLVSFHLEDYQTSVEKLIYAFNLGGIPDHQTQCLVAKLQNISSIAPLMGKIHHVL